jgi:hypothetical protein
MKRHLSEALDEQQRLRDLMRERERDMKRHLSEALDEQQRLRDLLALERARGGGEGVENLLLEAKQGEISHLQEQVRVLELQAMEREVELEQNAAWVREQERRLAEREAKLGENAARLGEQERRLAQLAESFSSGRIHTHTPGGAPEPDHRSLAAAPQVLRLSAPLPV